MINNQIFDDYLKKTKKIILEVPEVDLSKRPSTEMITALANVNSLGFEVTDSVYKVFLSLDTPDRDKFNEFYDSLIGSLRKMKGGEHDFTPFYKNFPKETLEMSDEQFYWNAFRYYFGMAIGIPEEVMQDAIAPEKNPRLPFMEKPDEYIKISTATMDDYKQYIKSLCESKANLGKGGEESLKVFFENHENVFPAVEEFCAFLRGIEPQNKSNMCIKDKLILDSDLMVSELMYTLEKDIKTPTDVLRLFNYDQTEETDLRVNSIQKTKTFSYYGDNDDDDDYGDGKKATKGYQNCSARKRKLYLSLLERTLKGSKAREEVWAHADLWKKAAFRLKPGKYMSLYPKAFEVINAVRNEKKPGIPLERNLTRAFQEKNTDAVEYIFAKNPGVMLQNMEKYLELMDGMGEKSVGFSRIKNILDDNAKNEINVRLIFRELTHCREMIKALENKKESFIYEGHGKTHRSYKTDKIITLTVEDYEKIQTILKEALSAHMAQKDILGKVYITPEAEALLDGIKAPMNLKNVNPAIRNLSEGSRIPISLSGKDLFRCFTQWSNLPGKPHHSYIDMHTFLLDEKGRFINFIGWNGVRAEFKEAFNYSGDMCAGCGSAAYKDVVTYTDVNLSAARNLQVNIYKGKNNISEEDKEKIDSLKMEIAKYKSQLGSLRAGWVKDETIYGYAKEYSLTVPEITDANKNSVIKMVKAHIDMLRTQAIAEKRDLLYDKVTPRYVAIALEDWSGYMINTAQCQCGVMLRDANKAQEGEVFEAGSVKDTFNVSCNAQNTVTFAFDLKTEEMIWVNRPYDINKAGESPQYMERRNAMTQAFNGVLEKEYVTMRDVLSANIDCRGERVDAPEKADVIISTENMDMKDGQTLINLFEPSLIAAEFLDCRFRPENILRFTPERQIEIITSYEGREHYDELVAAVEKQADKLPGERIVLESVNAHRPEDLSKFSENELSEMITKEVRSLEKDISDPKKVEEHNERIHKLNSEIKERKYPSHTHEIQAAMFNPLGNNSKARAKDKAHDERN